MRGTSLRTPQGRSADDFGKLVLRLAVGGLLIFHGIAKVQGAIAFVSDTVRQAGLPPFLAYGVYVAEIVAPILLIVGLWTRLAAAVIIIDMVAAILLALRDQMFAVKEQGGGLAIELELFFLLGALAIVFLGSGRLAIAQGRGKLD